MFRRVVQGEGEEEEGREEEEEDEEEAVSVRSLTVAGSNVYLVVSSKEICNIQKECVLFFKFFLHHMLGAFIIGLD